MDVGANVGVYTLLASGVCRSNTIAIEPIPATWKLLKEHLRINALESLVEAYQVGIGSVLGTLFFTTDLGPMNRVATEAEVLRKSEQVIPIPVITLDHLVKQRPVTCMKVDVEGYEDHVLTGAQETLSCETLKAIIIELCHNERCDLEAVHAMLTGKGFQPVRYDPFTRRFTPLKSFRRDQFNTLYVRDLGLVEQRVRDAPRVRVHGLEF
ncbi:MAG: FkbM family methyltransferase [Armatimonadota bacterium]